MEQIKEEGNTKENMDSSPKHVEEFQPEKHGKDSGVKQNLMDPNLRRIVSNHSAKKSKKKSILVKMLEEQAKMLQDQLAVLKPLYERQQKELQRLMEEEKALLQEMHDLQEKALLKDAEDEKNRNTIETLKEIRKQQEEELLKLDIDPLDPVFNAAPSSEDGRSGSKSS